MNKIDVMEKVNKSLFQLKFPKIYSIRAVTIMAEANPINIKEKLKSSIIARIIPINTDI